MYIFKDVKDKVIYIGKAKNLKNRVSSYFQPPERLGPKTALLVSTITSLDHIVVESEIEALLLESRLIKKFKPHFNLISKDDKSPYYINITQEKFPKPYISHQTKDSQAGPFLNSLIPRNILRYFRRITPFCIAKRPVLKPCFYSHLGLCQPCPGQNANDQEIKQYKLNIQRLKRLLLGQFDTVSRQLNHDMQLASKNLDFESAARLRDQISAIEQLKNRPVSPDEYLQNPNLVADTRQKSLQSLQDLFSDAGLKISNLKRIEMYDNAHLAGTSAASGMVVATNGELDHSQYRHFKIKIDTVGSDVDMMVEILTRRLNNPDWPSPDLIVLDGGVPQLSVVSHLPIPCPVIGLAKRFETIVIPRSDGQYLQINPPTNHPGLLLLESLRNEAHRFSRRLHHKIKSKNTFS